MKTGAIIITTRKLINTLRLPARWWLASIANVVCDPFAEPLTTTHAGGDVFKGCDTNLPPSDPEAMTVLLNAINLGASPLDLTRAAMSAARAVLPLTGQWKDEATAVIDAAEAWAANPNEENAKAVSFARDALIACHGGNWGNGDFATNNEFALMAVVAAAQACGFQYAVKALSLLAVDCAGHAAGDDIELAPLVTAVLL